MTITYIFQILEAVVKGDAEKYGVIPDMSGELQKAVRRSRRRIARLRERAQYELGEMDKAKVAAANDNMRRFTKSLGKIRNLNLEDCRGLIGIEDFLEDGNRIHEVMEMAEKIEHMSAVSSTAYTPMSLGFGVLETYTDVAPIEIDNRKFNAGDKEYCLQMIKKLHAFQDSVNAFLHKPSFLRQLNLVVSPQKQVYPQFFLQFMNRGCHRRLGNMQFLCSLRNAPAPTNAGKIFHLADLHIFSPSVFIHGLRAFALYRHDTERKNTTDGTDTA